MSVAQLLEEVKLLSVEEIEELETSLRVKKRRRMRGDAEELRWICIANEPLPERERHAELFNKKQEAKLSEAERAELLEIVLERETANVRRVEAVMRWSEWRDVPFPALWRQMMGEPPAAVVVPD